MEFTDNHHLKSSRFNTTAWTIVNKAGGDDLELRREALEYLIQTYWKPLYYLARYSTNSVDDAEDLVQSFFSYILESNSLSHADRERGRFRTFLRKSFKNFQIGEWRKQNAQKRGGNKKTVSINFKDVDENEMDIPSHDLTPDQIYDKTWARIILMRALENFKLECQKVNKMVHYELLQHQLGGELHSVDELAKKYGLSKSNINTQLYRSRKRLKTLMEKEVADQVSDPKLIQEELEVLRNALI